jgi:hypothetical protein
MLSDMAEGLPGPLRRLRRDPLAVVAVVLVALLASTTAGIHQAATIRVAAVVDAHWRGAYDILVRPARTRLDLESTKGLVEPNFVGFTGSGGIDVDELSEIRSLAGVELAAPIGFVGYVRSLAPAVVIELDQLPARPTLYRIDIVSTTTDGLSQQLVQRETGEILLGPPAAGDHPDANWVSNLGDVSANQDPDGRWIVDIVTKRALPGLAVPILAVDPAAEDGLLAGNASFLEPLRRAGSVDRTAGSFNVDLVDPAFREASGQLRSIQSPDNAFQSDRTLPVIPLVVSYRQAAALNVDLTVNRVGAPLRDYPPGGLAAAEAEAGPGTTLVGTATRDAGSSLAPLRAPSLCVPWPSSHATCGVASLFATASLDGRLVERPAYMAATSSGPDAGAPWFRIEQVGTVGPDGDPTTPDFRMGDLASTGAFPAYRKLRQVPLAVSQIPFSPHANIREPFVLAPIGTFDATAVKVPDDPIDYVPLGAYDRADTTYIADPSGAVAAPSPMRYPLLPDGLITTPPLAITDLAGAQVLRGDSPIDAVRVRVAGVNDFGPASQAKIETVATALERLGFDVDIVAGSSPQAVDVYVPTYHVDHDPAGDLGWVRQHWTTIGAAARVTHGFDASDLALLMLSATAAVIWALALAGLRAERKVRDAAILTAIGWSRAEIVRWLAGEPTVGAIVIAGLGMVGFVAGSGSPEAVAVAGGMALFWFFAGILAGLDAIRRARPSTLGSVVGGGGVALRVTVSGTPTYALRAAVVRWPWGAALAVGLGAGGAAVALGFALVAGLSTRIGPTLLASAAGAAAAVYQPIMLATIGVGSLAFVIVAFRLDRQRRAAEALILLASGWSSQQVRRLMWAGLVLPATVGASIAVVAVAALAGPFEIANPALPEIGAASLAGSAVLWGNLVVRRISASLGDIR